MSKTQIQKEKEQYFNNLPHPDKVADSERIAIVERIKYFEMLEVEEKKELRNKKLHFVLMLFIYILYSFYLG